MAAPRVLGLRLGLPFGSNGASRLLEVGASNGLGLRLGLPTCNTGRMLSSDPIAYFLTWTTYGSWLPGDERGWTPRGGGKRPPDPARRRDAAARLREPPVTLAPAQRALVDAVIRDHAGRRGWTLHAVNVRTNHVHVVVTAPTYAPKLVGEQFRGWGTRRLKAAHPGRENWWTEGGTAQLVFGEDDLTEAVRYVLEAQ